jgi:diadenylate cyclase
MPGPFRPAASSDLRDALAKVAPGTPLRAGVERVVRAKMGALVVVGDGPDVLAICSGGFPLDLPFTPQRLSELAKMDGAIILSSDGERIARANVHLLPDPSAITNETGTRHRTAERVARSLSVPVISISEEMAVIQVYVGTARHQVQDIGRLLDRANQALQTLERYSTRLDDAVSELTTLELEDLVTLRDVAVVLQRSEMVHRISDEIETSIIELGMDARLLRLQFDELYGDTDDDLSLVVGDYVPADRSINHVLDQLAALDDDQLLDLRLTAACLGLPKADANAQLDLNQGLSPRGARLLSRVPRLPPGVAVSVAEHFGDLSKVLRATVPNLMEIEGVSAERAQAIKDALSRLTEEAILDQYV